MSLERAGRIELRGLQFGRLVGALCPSQPAQILVGCRGVKPRWYRVRAGCICRSANNPLIGTPCGIRTQPNHLERVGTSPEVKRCINFGASDRNRTYVVRLSVKCSTIELQRQYNILVWVFRFELKASEFQARPSTWLTIYPVCNLFKSIVVPS